MAGDYIPHADEAFLEWSKNLVTYTAAHLTDFSVNQTALTPIQALVTTYEMAYTTAANPNRGKVDVMAKNQARDALKAALRVFIKAYLTYNPLVSSTDKEHMVLPLHDRAHSPVPPPSTIPEAELDSSVIRRVTVHFKDSGSSKRGKPKGVHGIELRWALLDAPPAAVTDLTNSAFDTATPYTFTFNETERGKGLYLCPRWENNKGEKGPWGEIVKAIVP
ncbi:MAG: hypothetical protein LBT13_05375 [Treponema sp.]|jgi:hypothetical protein|nr:hypothetical protein [Treponema sp.]